MNDARVDVRIGDAAKKLGMRQQPTIATTTPSVDTRILLLTSTQDPYFRDIFDVLFYPSLIHYRFRYNKNWVSDEFKTKEEQLDEDKIALMNGKDALIVLILTEQIGDREYKILEFLPVREATITEAKKVGDFVWIDFELGDWVVYKRIASPSERNEHHETIKNLMPKDSKEKVNRIVLATTNSKFDTISDFAGLDGIDTVNNWTTITTHVSRFSQKCNAAKSAIFLKFMKLVDTTNGETLKVTSVEESSGFELTSEHSYAIDIVEYTDQHVDPFELELKTNESMVSRTVGISEIRGKYDLLHFNFVSNTLTKNVTTTLSFETSSEKYIMARTYFWAKIKTKQWAYLVGPLLVLALSALFASDEFIKLAAGQPANVGTIVIGVVGSILSTIGTLYLRSK